MFERLPQRLPDLGQRAVVRVGIGQVAQARAGAERRRFAQGLEALLRFEQGGQFRCQSVDHGATAFLSIFPDAVRGKESCR